MNITTKYNVGDEVFFINILKIGKAKIHSIFIDGIKDDTFNVRYEISNEHDSCYRNSLKELLFKEYELSFSKEELIKSL